MRDKKLLDIQETNRMAEVSSYQCHFKYIHELAETGRLDLKTQSKQMMSLKDALWIQGIRARVENKRKEKATPYTWQPKRIRRKQASCQNSYNRPRRTVYIVSVLRLYLKGRVDFQFPVQRVRSLEVVSLSYRQLKS